MSFQYSHCYYHPSRDAIIVCDRCRQPICIQDRVIFKNEKYKLEGESTGVQIIICTICQSRKEQSNGFQMFLFVTVFLFFIIFSFVGLSSPSYTIPVSFVLVFFFILIIATAYLKAKKHPLRILPYRLCCFECGADLQMYDNNCKICGKEVSFEKHNYFYWKKFYFIRN